MTLEFETKPYIIYNVILLTRWAPESERALMSTMIMAGSQVRPGDTVLYLH